MTQKPEGFKWVEHRYEWHLQYRGDPLGRPRTLGKVRTQGWTVYVYRYKEGGWGWQQLRQRAYMSEEASRFIGINDAKEYLEAWVVEWHLETGTPLWRMGSVLDPYDALTHGR